MLLLFEFWILIPFIFAGIFKPEQNIVDRIKKAENTNDRQRHPATALPDEESLCIRMHNNTAFLGSQPFARMIVFSASDCRKSCLDIYPKCKAVIFYYLSGQEEGHICYLFEKNSVDENVALVPELPMRKKDMVRALEIVVNCHEFDAFPPLDYHTSSSTDKVTKKKRDTGYDSPVQPLGVWTVWSSCSEEPFQVRTQPCEYGRTVQRRRCMNSAANNFNRFRNSMYNIKVSYPPVPYIHPSLNSTEYDRIMAHHKQQMQDSCCKKQEFFNNILSLYRNHAIPPIFGIVQGQQYQQQQQQPQQQQQQQRASQQQNEQQTEYYRQLYLQQLHRLQQEQQQQQMSEQHQNSVNPSLQAEQRLKQQKLQEKHLEALLASSRSIGADPTQMHMAIQTVPQCAQSCSRRINPSSAYTIGDLGILKTGDARSISNNAYSSLFPSQANYSPGITSYQGMPSGAVPVSSSSGAGYISQPSHVAQQGISSNAVIQAGSIGSDSSYNSYPSQHSQGQATYTSGSLIRSQHVSNGSTYSSPKRPFTLGHGPSDLDNRLSTSDQRFQTSEYRPPSNKNVTSNFEHRPSASERWPSVTIDGAYGSDRQSTASEYVSSVIQRRPTAHEYMPSVFEHEHQSKPEESFSESMSRTTQFTSKRGPSVPSQDVLTRSEPETSIYSTPDYPFTGGQPAAQQTYQLQTPLWSEWENWSECSVTCGSGIKERYRYCNGFGCAGESVEQIQCDKTPCETWASWSPWSDCSVSCGMGEKTRSRYCHLGSIGCDGDSYEIENCESAPCVGWGSWQQWTPCSATCGEGTKSRSRTCDSVYCPGNAYEEEQCNSEPCSMWSEWLEWSECSVSCGEGIKQRSRICLGHNCEGESQDEMTCREIECPSWTEWGSWSDCSATCGFATRSRARWCLGNFCPGERYEEELCDLPTCSRWSQWQEWSQCSVSCGEGVQSRRRICLGLYCEGDMLEEIPCDQEQCAEWTEWEEWSSCSATCGTGTQRRLRVCSGQFCPGARSEEQICDSVAPCSFWSPWAEWSECSCTDTIRHRTRTCLFGQDCEGSDEESESCNGDSSCNRWTPWSHWSTCSQFCGTGKKSRQRECVDSNGVPTKGCLGSPDENIYCQERVCCVWSEWSRWSGCSRECDSGSMTRSRLCYNPAGFNSDTCQCHGLNKDKKQCNEHSCSKISPVVDIPSSSPISSPGLSQSIFQQTKLNQETPLIIPSRLAEPQRLERPQTSNLVDQQWQQQPEVSRLAEPQTWEKIETSGRSGMTGYAVVGSQRGGVSESTPKISVEVRSEAGVGDGHFTRVGEGAIPSSTARLQGCSWTDWCGWSSCSSIGSVGITKRSRFCIGAIGCVCYGSSEQISSCTGSSISNCAGCYAGPCAIWGGSDC